MDANTIYIYNSVIIIDRYSLIHQLRHPLISQICVVSSSSLHSKIVK